MHLLLTRPGQDVDGTAQRLRAVGHETTIQSMMSIEFAPEPVELIDPAAIVITSSNAARALAKWSIVAKWKDRPVFAIGDTTALWAREAGFANIKIGRGDGVGLYHLVRASVDPKGGPLLYPTAPNAPDQLPRKLSEAGFSIFAVPSYRRLPLEEMDDDVATLLTDGGIDGVLFYSRFTAAIFADLAKKKGIADKLGGLGFYVLAENIVEPLKTLNPAEIRVAENPNEVSLLDLIPVPADPR